ncbi:MAG: lipopolysaccharide biosynthesis protein [Rhodocyclaceae bacterium]|nr:lipopolysaccharide biosynthesis protein [Rhodocyclaceae bacterium]
MTIKEKALSGLRWTAGVRFVSQVLTWAMTLVVIRLLSPADYGLLAMATVVIAFLSMVSEIGLGPAIVQKAEIEPGVLNKIFGLVLIINLVICILLSLAAPAIAAFYQEERLVPLIRVMSLQFVISAFAVIPDALLQKQMEFRKRSLIDLGGSILGGGTTLACAFGGLGVWSLVAGTFVSQAWRVVGLNIAMGSWYRPSFSFVGLKPYVLFGGHLSLSGVLWFVYTQADVVIAGRWLGKEALGYYSVGMHLASLFNQRISGIINQVAFPAFSSIQHDLSQVAQKTLLGCRILSFFAFPVLWGISAVAPEIVTIVLGEKWIPAILPLSVLAVVQPLRIVQMFVPNAVQGIGRGDVILKNAVTACVIMPAAFLVGVNWGLLGLCIAWLIGSPLVFLSNSMRSMPALKMRSIDLLKTMTPTAISAAVMFGAVTAARSMGGLDSARVASLLILVTVGASTYAAMSWFTNRDGVREVVTIFRAVLRPGKQT